MFKVVRIPIPIPTFGFGGSKEGPTTASFKSQTGIASYYGSEHHGKQTASGESFDMYAMTAAHPTLPFDTKVKVTNLENGKSVVVRINDRGPFKPGRIIDLSQKAFSLLGDNRDAILRQGLVQVKIEPAK